MLYGGSGNDRVRTGEIGDLVWAGGDPDIMYGQDGVDILRGYGSNDDLRGGLDQTNRSAARAPTCVRGRTAVR